METQVEGYSSNVSKVDSKDQWELLVNKAKEQGSLIVAHFGASWCIPSVAMNSFFEELASTYSDVMFISVDVDDVKEVASKMEVKAMPTFLLMKDGVTVDKLVGANPDEIRRRVDILVQSTAAYMA
ncbi:Thioredoxin-like protein CXXS1 [Bienertia sinuspersici]